MTGKLSVEPEGGRPTAAHGAVTVLLVEDDASIANLLRAYLGRYGYSVVWVRSGEEALAQLERHPVRMVVLDIGLPGMDGFDVCRAIRARSTVPVVMLTAREEEVDRIAGLEVGADDYVAKPFSPRELAARIKAVLRRSEQATETELLTLADIALNRESREVTVDGRPIELTAKEFDLLAYLMEHAGLVFSRDQLLDRVWGLTYHAGTRTVDAHVANVRRKLGRPDLIRTVHSVGYKAVRE